MGFFDFFKSKKVSEPTAEELNRLNIKKLLNEMESVEGKLKDIGLYASLNGIKKIKDAIDDPGRFFTDEQVEAIKKLAGDINSHCKKEYAEIIDRKLSRIYDVVMGEIAKDANAEKRDNNEEKLIELKVEIDAMDKELAKLRKEENEALEKNDKIRWRTVKSNEKSLLSRKAIAEQRYGDLLALSENIQVAEAVKQSKDYSEHVENNGVDIVDIKSDAEYSRIASENVKETNLIVNDIVSEVLDSNDENFDFERAREEMIREQNVIDKNTEKNTTDGKIIENL